MPIINELNQRRNNIEFLITTVTLSSGNLIRGKLTNITNIHHRYFPIDVELVKKFIRLWKPDAVFFVDSLWPNLILILNKNKIPFSVINQELQKNL